MPNLSWAHIAGISLVGITLLLTVGFLMFKRLVTKGLVIVDAFPFIEKTVSKLEAAVPPKDFFDRCYAALDVVASHTGRLDRHDYRLDELSDRQEKDRESLGDLNKHTDLVLQRLDILSEETKRQTDDITSLQADITIIKRGMSWDGKERRRGKA